MNIKENLMIREEKEDGIEEWNVEILRKGLGKKKVGVEWEKFNYFEYEEDEIEVWSLVM